MDATQTRTQNILILDNELGMGGVEKKLFDFVSRIDRSRFNVAICCLKECGYFKSHFESMGVHVHENLLAHKYDVMAFNRFLHVLKEEEIDLVYTFIHPNTVIFATMARAMGKVKGAIVSLHAMGNAVGGKLVRGYQKPFLKKADALIAVAHKHKDYLAEVEGLDGSNISVIYNGVDVDKYHPGEPKAGVVAAMGIEPGDTVVTTVASLKPLKCIGNLLAAAQRIGRDDVKFVLAGDGPSRAQLEALAADLGVAERVTFLGIRDDVDEVLRASDILVLPSRTEAFPNVVLEAMATGLPVVTTDVGSVREIVADGENGWIVPKENVDALTEKLVDLLDDPDKARRFGARGREIVEADFQLAGMVDKRQALFDSVLAREEG